MVYSNKHHLQSCSTSVLLWWNLQKEIVPPEPANENEVVEWAYSHQTEPLLEARENG